MTKRETNLILVFLIIAFFGSVFQIYRIRQQKEIPAKAAGDIYISQNESGLSDGSSCGNSKSLAWLNAVSSWTATQSFTDGLVGPGDTVHLCGTFNISPGTIAITIQGNGTAGNPITIYFEPNAKFIAPWFSGNYGGVAGGVIYMKNRSYITIDGGTNGTIESTDTGSQGFFTYYRTSQNAGDYNINGNIGVNISGGSNITVKNLKFLNLYQSIGSIENPYWPGKYGDVPAYVYAAGVDLSASNNILIENNEFEYSGTGVKFGINNNYGIEIKNNIFHRVGISAFGSCMSNQTDTIRIHHNTTTHTSDWAYNDGFKFFGESGSDALIFSTCSGVKIYNNTIGPNISHPNHSATAWILVDQGYFVEPEIYNNILIGDSDDKPANGFITVGGRSAYPNYTFDSRARIYSNTIISQTNLPVTGIRISNNSTGNKVFNNIIYSTGTGSLSVMSFSSGSLLDSADYNLYHSTGGKIQYSYTGQTFTNEGQFNPPRTYTYSLAEWQALGFDHHSLISNPLINLNGILNSASPAINSGFNLGSPYHIDYANVSRPQGSSWDIGAYEYVSSTPTPTPTPNPTPSYQSGDLNSDTRVNSIDFGIMMSYWGALTKPKSDINQDGYVNSVDFGIMLSQWTG